MGVVIFLSEFYKIGLSSMAFVKVCQLLTSGLQEAEDEEGVQLSPEVLRNLLRATAKVHKSLVQVRKQAGEGEGGREGREILPYCYSTH